VGRGAGASRAPLNSDGKIGLETREALAGPPPALALAQQERSWSRSPPRTRELSSPPSWPAVTQQLPPRQDGRVSPPRTRSPPPAALTRGSSAAAAIDLLFGALDDDLLFNRLN
jgi:hypothetical protein